MQLCTPVSINAATALSRAGFDAAVTSLNHGLAEEHAATFDMASVAGCGDGTGEGNGSPSAFLQDTHYRDVAPDACGSLSGLSLIACNPSQSPARSHAMNHI